ncbi:MAG TPA: AmmeMemoRadiSam system radical SAM enzyme, partial [Candidatus Atribacteria bacterium]|nr:AmmeMemoRadiSam system radical SAM enzyme [Candidatus Atribacteria bacterium]
MKVAHFFTNLENNRVQCLLCPHQCIIAEGRRGTCRVRKNEGGILYAQTYGKISSLALDPIEKKPLYHFYPGREILSVGSVGCNLHCSFCQNWSISQASPENFSLREANPEDLASLAHRNGSIGLSYTYNEPFIWWEFVYDTAQLVQKKGLKNVLVTNGYVEEEPLRELLPWIDALNVDLKSMDDDFYRHYCGGTLSPVLRTIEISVQ